MSASFSAVLVVLAVQSSMTIPPAFHGTWSFDDAACRNPAEVRMRIDGEGYTREEINGTIDNLIVLSRRPLRVRLTASVSAEGWRWTEIEEWTLSPSGDGFVNRSNLESTEPQYMTQYVRCV